MFHDLHSRDGCATQELMTEFERTVLADLATLKAEMRQLLGNGQPGRLAQIEHRVDQHEHMVQRATGVGAVVGGLLALVHIGIDFFKKNN